MSTYFQIESEDGMYWAGDDWTPEHEECRRYSSEKTARVALTEARAYGGRKARNCELIKYSREVVNA